MKGATTDTHFFWLLKWTDGDKRFTIQRINESYKMDWQSAYGRAISHCLSRGEGSLAILYCRSKTDPAYTCAKFRYEALENGCPSVPVQQFDLADIDAELFNALNAAVVVATYNEQ